MNILEATMKVANELWKKKSNSYQDYSSWELAEQHFEYLINKIKRKEKYDPN